MIDKMIRACLSFVLAVYIVSLAYKQVAAQLYGVPSYLFAIALSEISHNAVTGSTTLNRTKNPESLSHEIRFKSGEYLKVEAEADNDALKQAAALEAGSNLSVAASNKIRGARALREYTAKVLGELDDASDGKKREYRDEISFDNAQANLLYAQADSLLREALSLKNSSHPTSQHPDPQSSQGVPTTSLCDILKIGPIKFQSNPDELTAGVGTETMGQITDTSFTIFERKKPKMTFFWEDVNIPIRSTADSPNCFVFKYRTMDQALCAHSRQSRNSWIDAMTETWFCKNRGIKGILPSVKEAEKEEKKIEEAPQTEKKDQDKEKDLVDVDVAVDNEGHGSVNINGHKQM